MIKGVITKGEGLYISIIVGYCYTIIMEERMTKTINISDKAYEWLLKKASRQTIELKQNVSIADVVDEVIEK